MRQLSLPLIFSLFCTLLGLAPTATAQTLAPARVVPHQVIPAQSIAASSDISVTKTDNLLFTVPGVPNIYTITVVNLGPDAAPFVTVTDLFPAIYTNPLWTCSGAGGGTCRNGFGVGNINSSVNLPAGGSATFRVAGLINAAATGLLTNTATITSSVPDPNSANNTSTDITFLAPLANLALTKRVTPTVAAPGQALTFTLVYTNLGPATALGTFIADLVPLSITNLAYTSSGPIITPTGGITYAWLVNNVAPNARGRITITGNLAWGIGPGVLTNTAYLINLGDLITDNNTSAVTLTILNRAPQAVAWATTPVFVGASATLSGTASRDPDQHALAYLWRQTGGAAVTFNPALSVTTFTAPPTPGPLTFTLIITDAFGLTSTTQTAVNVVDYAIAGLAAANSSPTQVGQPTFFTATITSGSNVTYTWNFGDGATALGATANHAYSAAGNYTAIVTATNRTGSQTAQTAVNIAANHLYLPFFWRAPAPDLIVQSLSASANAVTVTLKNIGPAATLGGFWVDVYVAPNPAPTAVNQTWQDLGAQGLAWGVTDSLAPGATLVLTLGDMYFQPDLSTPNLTLAPGTPLYAQVDSVGLDTTYGGVLEMPEALGLTYNNILGPVLSTQSTVPLTWTWQRTPSATALPRRK